VGNCPADRSEGVNNVNSVTGMFKNLLLMIDNRYPIDLHHSGQIGKMNENKDYKRYFECMEGRSGKRAKMKYRRVVT
jgi:hypothetical protein